MLQPRAFGPTGCRGTEQWRCSKAVRCKTNAHMLVHVLSAKFTRCSIQLHVVPSADPWAG